jgi:SPP1 family predicted phage head-tail adaptor
MISGRMRHRVGLLRGVISRAASGAAVTSWPPAAGTERELWAGITYQGGREFAAAKAIHAETEIEFLLRPPVDILPTDRIRYSGELYDVLGIDRHSSAAIVRVRAKTAMKP